MAGEKKGIEKKERKKMNKGPLSIEAAARLPKCFTEVRSALGAEPVAETVVPAPTVLLTWL